MYLACGPTDMRTGIVIARISDLPVSRLPKLLPWKWKPSEKANVKAA